MKGGQAIQKEEAEEIQKNEGKIKIEVRFEGKVYMATSKLRYMRRKRDISNEKNKEMCEDNVRKQKLTTAILKTHI